MNTKLKLAVTTALVASTVGSLGYLSTINALNELSSSSKAPPAVYSKKLDKNSFEYRLCATKNGIAAVESAGAKNPYVLKSKPSRNGDRAYGKYQIMGNNIPSWSKEALGKRLTIQEFLNSPALQEKIVDFHIGRNLKKYSPQDVACIWFSGRTCKKAGNAKDVYGTSVPQYVAKFNRNYVCK